ncbi:MAG: glycosyltransferase, partial [Candidatus Omnitrophica bacterium]|nr:glycosyltransferase [Candidatus Omnitrophota bacterium]
MKCGVGDYSNNLAKALSVIPGIRVGVLTSFLKEKIEASSIDIFPTVKRWSLAELANVLKTIRRFSPDIVHLQYPTQGYGTGLLPWVLPIFCFLMRKKVVQTWHEGYGRRDAWRLFLKSLVPSMLIFVRPRYSEKVLHPHLRWALWKKKSVFIPNASGIYRACLTDTE